MDFFKFFVLFFTTTIVFSQGITYKGSIEGTGVFSTEDENPFWMYTNTNASLGEEINFSTTGEFSIKYDFSNSFIEAGAAYYYRNEVLDEFQRRDLYIKFQNNWLKATLGSKKQEVYLNDLSVSNKNFLWSGNARPLPGLILEANNPIKISSNISVDWGIAHYSLNDERFVDNTRVHYKRLGLIWNINKKKSISGRIQHFAQWGGTSPESGEQPTSFKDFLDVFVAKQTGDRSNALGNHLGSYFLEYNYSASIGKFSFYHEHPFEDGSGTRFANFPDGIWGVFYEPTNTKIFTSILYEYIDTTDQSGALGGSGRDSYFNNRTYRSGWTYEGNTIGLPLLTVPSNSRVRAHQFGFTSVIKDFKFTFKSTFVQSLGTYFVPFTPKENAIYNYLKTDYNLKKAGEISLLLGYDYKDVKKDILGAGLKYKYTF
jgi:hypothetical protein